MQNAQMIQDFPQTQHSEALNTCCLVVDGNIHHACLSNDLPAIEQALFSEAMLPQIRTTALLIAASRHTFSKQSPTIFADEADWFAARILVLQARVFHLDISLRFMLETANRRAKAFAEQHQLPFTPAKIRMSMNSSRPKNLLIMECALNIHEDNHGLIANTQALAKHLQTRI